LVWPLLYSARKGESAVDALLLKVPEVAEQLGISRAKAYELIAAGTSSPSRWGAVGASASVSCAA
jgi:predicted DNA-binding transcriptional regulator AlpA